MTKVKTNKINALQLYSVLFVLKIFFTVTFSTIYGYSNDIRTALFAPLVNFLLGFVLFLPSYFIKTDNENKMVNFMYAVIFFLCILKVVIAFMGIYEYVSYGQKGVIVLVVFLMLCCGFCGGHGLQGISRSSVLIAFVSILIIIMFGFGIREEFDIYNHLNNEGFSMVEIKNISSFFSNQIEFCALPLAIRTVEKNKFSGFCFWNILSTVVVTAIIYISGLSLGMFGKECVYPIYDAFSVSKISVLKRLDSLYIILAVFSCVCTISLFISLFGKTVEKISGSGRKSACYVCSIAVIAVVWFLNDSGQFGEAFLNNFLWSVLIIMAAIILPLLNCFKIKRKNLISFLLAIASLVSLCSCSGPREINERLIVTAIGVDFKDDKFSIIMRALNTDESADEEHLINITSKDKSINSAISAVSLQTGKEPYFGQCLFVLIGKEALDKKFEEILDLFKKDFYSDGNVNIFSTSETAEKIINFNDGINPEQVAAISDNKKFGSFSCDLVKAYNDYYNETSSLLLPSIEINETEDGIVEEGGILLNKNGVCGSFDKDQMIAYGILIGQTTERISFEGSYIKLKSNDSEINFESSDRLSVTFMLTIEAEERLEEDDIEILKKRCIDTVKYAVSHGCEVFNIGKKLYLDNYDIYKTIDNPKEKILNADYKININFTKNSLNN